MLKSTDNNCFDLVNRESYLQTEEWSVINHIHNNRIPFHISKCGIYCLFGIDFVRLSATSYGGPLISSNCSPEDFKKFLIEVGNVMKQKKIKQINFLALPPLRKWDPCFELMFEEFGYSKTQWDTIIIDLTRSEDELLKSFKHAVRKGINKAASLEVQIKRVCDFESYYNDFLVPYNKIKERPSKDKSIYKQMWDITGNKTYNYWVASDLNGALLGFLGTYRYNGVATEIMSAMTEIAFKNKVPVQDALHWEILKYHRNCGDKFFDLAGVNPNPANNKEQNIKRFKQKWGGQVKDTSSFTFSNVSPLKELLLKLKRKVHG